jgi:hypothetical protein
MVGLTKKVEYKGDKIIDIQEVVIFTLSMIIVMV